MKHCPLPTARCQRIARCSTVQLSAGRLLSTDELIPLETTIISNSSEGEFFIFNESNLQQSNVDTELISFFNDKQKTLDTLNNYPRVKKALIKFNTSLCSSAPVKRLFSFAGFIHSPTRGLLSDKMFETLVFLKGNKNYQSLVYK